MANSVPVNFEGVTTYNILAASCVYSTNNSVTFICEGCPKPITSKSDTAEQLCIWFVDHQRMGGIETHEIRSSWGRCVFIVSDLISFKLEGMDVKLRFTTGDCYLLLHFTTTEEATRVTKDIVARLKCAIFTREAST
jgi:hypothetical protein